MTHSQHTRQTIYKQRHVTARQKAVITAATTIQSAIESEEPLLDLNLLMIDYYDSFTYNLVHMLAKLCRKPPLVLTADCAKSWDELMKQINAMNMTAIDGVILSPGPGHPCHAPPLGIDIIKNNPQLPILGVCLGHQILGHVYGAKVQSAPVPIHGQVWPVRIVDKDDDVWRNISSPVPVTRYHSLCVTDLPPLLTTTAVSDDDDQLIMGLRHNEYPHYGVQFHPESIGTPCGRELLRNFCQVVVKNKETSSLGKKMEETNSRHQPSTNSIEHDDRTRNSVFLETEVFVLQLPRVNAEPEDVMKKFLLGDEYSFWLDSSDIRADPSISILGSSKERVEYWGKEKSSHRQGLYHWHDNEMEHFENLDILTYMEKQYTTTTNSVSIVSIDANGNLNLEKETEMDLNLPFRFRGGHVGYLGYEVRHDTLRFLEQQDHGQHIAGRIQPDDSTNIPTAAFLVADRSFVFDHSANCWYLVGTSDSSRSREEVIMWLKDIFDELQCWTPVVDDDDLNLDLRSIKSSSTDSQFFRPHRSETTYNFNFDECIKCINRGDSYELCLTNQLEAKVSPDLDPFQLYRRLRRRNPAPYGAFFRWGEQFSICCSSPERFLSVTRDGVDFCVETKPIKGTIARALPAITKEQQEADQARARELQNSVKDRAENLMIVDLLRNDFSRVCNDVYVAKLMEIETFATVHQMVSTIRGTLQKDRNVIDVLKACFPGGSMTGAPKRITMDILDELEEGRARGPYSGSLGYFSRNGCMDMNIVIRTAVVEGSKVTVGSGGAITALSQQTDEYNELMLKASAVVNTVEEWAGGLPDDATPSDCRISTLEATRM
ncbi:para-aminobenzoate synthetase [Fistulifera solaris]|uniref:aminodeoxychorismate synthase n=1 Tax=Fistulifera solaris TaxID=1519565 RepID=A0A1Z5J8X9_FISSO|nr:para-aminobenzoate synthetase [Fistulifera solaris]|eukprot:GAX10454.1 para-aminobenzoate synthetase [Fistulifera solaris]